MTFFVPPISTLASTTLAQSSGAGQTLFPYMGVFFVAFFVAILATPLMRWLAVKNGVVDWPDLKRKNHALPVAYLGGVAIFLGWFAGTFSGYLITPDWIIINGQEFRVQRLPITILIGATVITITGLIDDVTGIRARVKIGGQLFAAAALTWSHIGLDLTETVFNLMMISPSPSVVYSTATFMVALFVLGGCNAVNLIDGLDGLAAGVVAIAMVGFLAIALIVSQQPGSAVASMDNPNRIVFCLAAIGAILGFLPYNFNPASIFMGDAGSLLLGFLSVTAILMFGDAGGYSLKLVTASLIIFAVPITDTSLAIIRRKMRGQPIFAPDNQHMHHLLRKAGLSVKKSVFVMYGAAALFAAVGIGMIGLELHFRYSLALFCVIYGFIMVTAFKYGAHCLAMDRLRQQELDALIAEDAPINRSDQAPAPENQDSALGLSPLTDSTPRN